MSFRRLTRVAWILGTVIAALLGDSSVAWAKGGDGIGYAGPAFGGMFPNSPSGAAGFGVVGGANSTVPWLGGGLLVAYHQTLVKFEDTVSEDEALAAKSTMTMLLFAADLNINLQGGLKGISFGPRGGLGINTVKSITSRGGDFIEAKSSGTILYVGGKAGYDFPISTFLTIGIEASYLYGMLTLVEGNDMPGLAYVMVPFKVRF